MDMWLLFGYVGRRPRLVKYAHGPMRSGQSANIWKSKRKMPYPEKLSGVPLIDKRAAIFWARFAASGGPCFSTAICPMRSWHIFRFARCVDVGPPDLEADIRPDSYVQKMRVISLDMSTGWIIGILACDILRCWDGSVSAHRPPVEAANPWGFGWETQSSPGFVLGLALDVRNGPPHHP